MSFRDRDVEKKSSALGGRRLAFGVCAGIGAVEVVRIVRELRRHGAEVTIFTTQEVPQFVGLTSLEWAAGKKVVDALTASVDGLEDFDLVAVAPVTLNTLVKLSLGLCDTPVTMVTGSQFGKRGKVLLFPAMHRSLYLHPAFAQSVATLKEWGAKVLLPPEEEGRLKMPTPEQVAHEAIQAMAGE